MNRRGFLAAMLAAGSAPAIVKAESLMKIVVPKREILRVTGVDMYSVAKRYADNRMKRSNVFNDWAVDRTEDYAPRDEMRRALTMFTLVDQNGKKLSYHEVNLIKNVEVKFTDQYSIILN